MAFDVFISHSSTDKKVADSVCEFLESKGVRCWIAPRDILPGEEWGDSILRGIVACPVMVLIFSKSANDSGPVRSEVDRAMNARKVLIPFRIENVPPTGAMEFHIGRRHWLDAYTPGINRHLELLARAVADVLKPPGPLDPADSAPPGTLTPTSGRRLETASLPEIQQDESIPLRLSFNFNHVVVVGHPSTFQVMVENKGTTTLERVEIAMESRGLQETARKILSRLGAGQTQRHLFEIEPIRSGNFALRCAVKCQEETTQLAFVGSRTLRINEAPGTVNVEINMQDLKANAKSASGDIDVSALVGSRAIHTLNDLLNLELPENFEPLELALDYEVSIGALAQEQASAHHRLQIPAAFLNQAQEGAVLKLSPVQAAATSPLPEVRLVSRTSFILGRSREEADFLTWFWPRNEANDQKTRHISKRHCTFMAKDAKIFVRDNETSNRTMLEGQALNAQEGERLERRGILKLAGSYFLDVTPFGSSAPEGPTIINLRNWSGPKEFAEPSVHGSVRFLPMMATALPQYSVWLLTDGAFGTSRANPIILEVAGLAEIQGRFFHRFGNFWIESSTSNGAVQVNGVKLEPGLIAPLIDGNVVKLGTGSFRVSITA
jgi:pSer/pThr/pTyr-binding forkhead associated (FHA) protein